MGVVDPDQGHLTEVTIALCSVFPGNPIGNTSCENIYEEGATYFGEQVFTSSTPQCLLDFALFGCSGCLTPVPIHLGLTP